jgi:hypothetical protein
MLLSSKGDAILKKVRNGEASQASAQLKVMGEKIDDLLKVPTLAWCHCLSTEA